MLYEVITGVELATTIMKRAIYKRGADIADNFSPYAPSDLKGLKDAFLDFIPDAEKMFSPEVAECTDDSLRVITSYSIHYTKLYEPRTPQGGTGAHGGT